MEAFSLTLGDLDRSNESQMFCMSMATCISDMHSLKCMVLHI